MIKKIFSCLLFTISYVFAQGQNNGATIHVFQPTEQTQTTVTAAHRDSMKVVDKNCIKWNWSVLTRGVFLINYERYLSSNFSLELGAGITYRDFLFENTKTVGGDTIQQFSASNYGTASPNFCGEIGLRYYPSGFDNMEGVFLEATVSYRAYSFPNATFTPIVGISVPGYTFVDGQFKFGYVFSHWFSDFVSEVYIGIGMRSLTANMYETITVPNSYGYNSIYYQPVTIKETYPQPILGFKIGYPF